MKVSAAPPPRLQALIVWPDSPEDLAEQRVCGVPLQERTRRVLGAAGLDVRERLEDIKPDQPMLVVRGDWMVDRRLLQLLAAAPGEVALGAPPGSGAGWIARVVPRAPKAGGGAPERLLAPDTELATLDAEAVDPYVQTSRRAVPVRLMPLNTVAARAAAEQAIMADAQKGVLDWPARFIHAPLENVLARLLWPTAVTPNQISLATFALGLGASGLFAAGLFWPALLAALVCGALDGVDGKLARTKLLVTAAGEWEHVGDKVVEYLWYLGLGVGLAHLKGSWPPLAAAAIASAAMGADVAVGTAAQKRLGRQLDDMSAFDRGLRLVAARRNTNMWMLLAFAAFGAWREGLFAIAALAVVSLSIHLVRLQMAARSAGPRSGGPARPLQPHGRA